MLGTVPYPDPRDPSVFSPPGSRSLNIFSDLDPDLDIDLDLDPDPDPDLDPDPDPSINLM